MKIELTDEQHLKIIKFLYQFKDDNKFYKLDETLLDTESKKETYSSIYMLRDHALIATDSEVYFNSRGHIVVEKFNNADEVRAKILPKGISVLEATMENFN